jgi:hypothetical protein
MSTAVLEYLPDLGLEEEPEYVLLFTPPVLYERLRDRLRRPGFWELLTVAEYEAGTPARDGWSHHGYPDNYPVMLAAWVKALLGFPVALERDEAEVMVPGRFSRWRTVPLYWVRRST